MSWESSAHYYHHGGVIRLLAATKARRSDPEPPTVAPRSAGPRPDPPVAGAARRRRGGLKAASAGQLVPRIHGTFPLDRSAEAHEALQGRGSIGAVLITHRRAAPGNSYNGSA